MVPQPLHNVVGTAGGGAWGEQVGFEPPLCLS